jgi:hypothetical protein
MKTKLTSLALVFLLGVSVATAADDPLPSWNDTESKKAIIAFVEKVTKEGSPDFVPVPERIAVFDNDGTLWAELARNNEIATLVLNDDKAGKPVGIQRHIGRRPIAAFGNSDGDLQMLQWTAAGGGPRFCLYVHHTDAEREWAYDRKSHVGELDQGLDEAKAKGWTVVSMKDDWKAIYP